jgi:ABC-type dipeptide/oligopeptide/nickel transport system permease component
MSKMFVRVFKLLIEWGTLIFIIGCFLKILPGNPYIDEKVETFRNWNSDWNSFLSYLKNSILNLDFGISLVNAPATAESLVQDPVKISLILGVCAFIISIMICLSLTFFYISTSKKWIQRIIDELIVLVYSLPQIFLAPFLLFFFSNFLKWSPLTVNDNISSWILPILSISIRPSFTMLKILISNFKKISENDYIRTAKAKGLTAFRIHFVHILKPALAPLLAYANVIFLNLVSGSVIVEILFNIHGAGMLMSKVISERDYPVILQLVASLSLIMIIADFVFEKVLIYLDPRLITEVNKKSSSPIGGSPSETF